MGAMEDAVLSVLVEAKGIAQANRDIMTVEATLRDAEQSAHDATRAVERFGLVRAKAEAEVDSAGVHREIQRASREVRAFGRIHSTATLDVDTRSTDRDAKTATSDLRQLTAAMGGAGNGAVAMRGSLGPLSGGLGVVAISALALSSGLLAILGPAAAVAAALAPLIGLAAGVGGALVAAGQGFGVFKLATMGVMDALKEQNQVSQKAGGQALKQAGQEQSAARAIASAQEGVRSAREAATRASEALDEAQRQERLAMDALAPAYVEARRRLEDLGDAAVSSSQALDSARASAMEARTALAALLSGPDPRTLADAHRAVSAALREEDSAVRSVERAHQALIDASRGESAAVRDLTDARRALEDLMRPADALDLADAQDRVNDSVRDEERARLRLLGVIADQSRMQQQAGVSAAQWAQAAAHGITLPTITGAAADPAAAALDLADAQNAVEDASRDALRVRQQLAALEAGPGVDQIAAARQRVSDAEYAVGAAARATAEARRGITDAEADVATATEETAQARRDAMIAEAPASSSAVAAARREVAEAEQDVTEATRAAGRAASDYKAAQEAGIGQAPSVVAAREAVRSATKATSDAERSLADATRQVALAQQGVRDAQMSAVQSSAVAAGAAMNLNKKLDALPPSARAFVLHLMSMKDKAQELRTVAADGFFPGAQAGLDAAMHSFEPVKRVIGATATVLGDLTRRAGELVGSGPFGRDIETIGMRNTKVLDTMGTAVLHIVSAMRHVLVAAGPLTQWLADTANGWALNAAESAKAGRESGRMAAFFERTRAVLERLGSIISHTTHGLFGIGKAGTDSGNSILLSIDRAAKRFDAWSNSVAGQHAIREFFERTKDLAAALLPAIANLATGFGVLTLKLLPITTGLRLIGPYADEAIVAFIGYKVAVTAAAVATGLMNAATLVMGTRLGAAALYTAAWRASAIAATVATAAMTAGQWLLNAALLANPIGLVVAGLAVLVGGLIVAYKHSETFRDIVSGAFAAVSTAFGWLLNAAQNVLGWLKDHWPLVLSILTGPIGAAVIAIARHWDSIRGAAQSAWNAIQGAARVAWDAISSAVTTPIRAARDAMEAIVTGIANRVDAAWQTVRGATSSAWGAASDAVLGAMRGARDALESVLGGIGNRVESAWSSVKSATTSAWGSVKKAITGAVDGALDAVRGVLGQFVDIGGDIVRGIARGITGAASSVVHAIGGVVGDAIHSAKGLLGIHSPSRVFAEVGSNVSLGLAEGIAGDVGSVASAIRALTDATRVVPITGGAAGGALVQPASSATPGAPASRESGGNGFDVQVSVNGGSGKLEQLLAEMIEVRITRRGQALAGQWKAGIA